MRLLILASVVLFLPSAAGQTLVAATVEDGTLEVHVDAGAGTGAQVLVTHEDPLEGTVVDRIVPVTFEPGATAQVRISALPRNVSLQVHVVPPDIEVPLLHDATRVLEGGLEALATLASLEAPPVPPLGRDGVHAVAGYPVTDDRWWWGPFRIVAFADGPIAYLWRANDGPDTGAGAELKVAWSHDGGRSWGPNTTLAQDVGHHVDSVDAVSDGTSLWVAARSADGPLHILRQAGGQTETVAAPDDGVGSHRIAAVGGGLLLATLSHRWGAEPDPSVAFRQIQEGDVGAASVLATPGVYGPAGFRLAAHGDRALLAYAAGDADERTLRLHWSDDGGTAWTAPQTIALPASRLQVDAVVVDSTGAGHVVATDWGEPVEVGACTASRPTVHHVRIDPGGTQTVRALSGPDGVVADSRVGQEALVAAWGSRLWVFFTDLEFGPDCTGQGFDWAVESVDLGRTWGPGYLLERTTAGPIQASSVTVLPDGIPAFAASFLYGPGDARLSFLPMFERVANETTTLTEVLHVKLQAGGPGGGPGGGSGSDTDGASRQGTSGTDAVGVPPDPAIPGLAPVALPLLLAWLARRR